MPTQYDCTTLERAALRLRVSSTDAELPAQLTAASQALADWLGYELYLRESVEETVPSEGGRYLVLRAGQVRQVARVVVEGRELPATEYRLDSPRQGRLVRRRGRWPFTGDWSSGVAPVPLTSVDTGQVVVSFSAGWRTPGQVSLVLAADPTSTLQSELPAVLEEACLTTLTSLRTGAGRDSSVTSRTVGSASVTWDPTRTAVPALARQLAAPYYQALRRRVS